MNNISYCKTLGCLNRPIGTFEYCNRCLQEKRKEFIADYIATTSTTQMDAIQAMPTFTLMDRVAKIEAFLKYKYEEFK